MVSMSNQPIYFSGFSNYLGAISKHEFPLGSGLWYRVRRSQDILHKRTDPAEVGEWHFRHQNPIFRGNPPDIKGLDE